MKQCEEIATSECYARPCRNCTPSDRSRAQIITAPYIDDRLRLMAQIIHNAAQVVVEINSANGATRTAEVRVPGRYNLTVPFASILCVWLAQGSQVVEMFGRPPAATVPTWVEFAEVQS